MSRALPLVALATLLAGCRDPEPPVHLRVAGGDAARGREVALRIGCGACHVIPGVAGAIGTVGPSLDGFGRRTYITGRVPNRPGALVQFVRNAPALAPHTAMPDLPIGEGEARDLAAFLYTLR